MVSVSQIAEWVQDARQQTWALVADLSDDELLGPRLELVNPLLWEIGHVAWFQEKWVLRHAGRRSPIRADGDSLYDSAAIPHDARWDLPLPTREETLHYMMQVRDQVIDYLQQPDRAKDDIYFATLSVFHEDMHSEAFTYTRQTLGYRSPNLEWGGLTPLSFFESKKKESGVEPPHSKDAAVPGGSFPLGALPDEAFVFDNEKWAHAVEVRPFAIARTPVTQAEFAAFVSDGGYEHRSFWTDEGWQWRTQNHARHPLYWKGQGSANWLRRDFDRWVALEPERPVIHVNWYEADAYCRWAGRRLPTELEWEVAASIAPSPPGTPGGHGSAPSPQPSPPEYRGRGGSEKRRFPWGAEAPTPERANLDWRHMGCIDVHALPKGDSFFGCRQMIGNVWEWTASTFLPYPGFVADPYKEYSAPWFGTHKVLRGGCWATRARLLRNTWRNFYRPERRDVWAGFRTCAVDA